VGGGIEIGLLGNAASKKPNMSAPVGEGGCKRQAVYVYRNTEARSHFTVTVEKAISVSIINVCL
jgi:hypothetical protein